jgi:hypothetical protein
MGGAVLYFLPQHHGVRALAQTQKKADLWVAQIDDKTISLDEFEREFSVHVFSLPIVDEDKDRYEGEEANKKRFLTNLINEYLIYNDAVENGYLKRNDIKDLINAVARRAVIQVYLSEKIEPLLEDVPDEQIEVIYNQNKKLFAGMDIDVARQQIKLQLLQKQYNDKLNELIDTLMGEAKVVRNQEVGL